MNAMAIRIKERRKLLGLTQEELAEKLGLQKSAIAKYENGRVENIKRSVIDNMSKILQCSPSYLLGLDSPVSPDLSTTIEKIIPPEKYFLLDEMDQAKVDGYIDALLLGDKYSEKGKESEEKK